MSTWIDLATGHRHIDAIRADGHHDDIDLDTELVVDAVAVTLPDIDEWNDE